jgi:2-polyprenyl-6-methoxyphenol hydroxylase-like FAD-dependent oxidoreductase
LADLLRERGAEVEYDTEAVALDPGTDTASASVTLRKAGSGEEVVRAKYVVGCEGSNSLVRKTLGLTFEGERYAGEQFIQADCKIAWSLPSGRAYLFLTDDGYLMVIELPGGLVRIFISLPDADGSGQAAAAAQLGAVEDLSAQPSLDDIREQLLRLTGFDAELSGATWLARYRTSHRYANTFGKGRCFIAGDAGHVHVPIGGQGMNTGIQDAFNLGWKLAGVCANRYRPDILETYDAERRPVAKALLDGTDRSYRGILHPSELQQRMVRMFGPFVMKTDVAQEFMAATLEELSIAYDETPLNRDLGGSTGPKAGERARIDAPGVRASDKQTVLLADVTRQAEWTLLVFGGAPGRQGAAPSLPAALSARFADLVTCVFVTVDAAPAPLAGFTTLIDLEEHLHESYGVRAPAVYLVRPDGVVALRSPGSDIAPVVAYLDALLIASAAK